MFNIGEKIVCLRKKFNMNQNELAEKLNISKQSLLNYETEKRLIPLDVLANMSKVFNISIETFFSNEIDEFKNIESNETFKRIPIISKVSAGRGEYGVEDILDWLEMPVSLCDGADYATFVKGDSMEPKILDGDLILVKKDEYLNNGNIGVFKVGENVFCKKYFNNPITKEVILKSLNPKYDPIYLDKNFHDDFYILGRVICKIDYNF